MIQGAKKKGPTFTSPRIWVWEKHTRTQQNRTRHTPKESTFVQWGMGRARTVWLVQKGGWQKNKSTCLVNLINKMRWVYFMLWRKQVRTASVTSVHIRPLQHVCFLKRNACKQYTKIICLQVIQGAKKKGSHIHIPKDMSVGKTYLHPTKQNQTHT